jgi:hypothetical protein
MRVTRSNMVTSQDTAHRMTKKREGEETEYIYISIKSCLFFYPTKENKCIISNRKKTRVLLTTIDDDSANNKGTGVVIVYRKKTNLGM